MGTETFPTVSSSVCSVTVEKMGPLRGDGNVSFVMSTKFLIVEKMGPLRGDGNDVENFSVFSVK